MEKSRPFDARSEKDTYLPCILHYWRAMGGQDAVSDNLGVTPQVIEMSTLGDDLIEAAMSGDVVKVRRLVANGADVNYANRLGVTPLMVAAQWNRPNIVSFLLSKHADVETKENSSGCNALIFACVSGNSDIVGLILAHGAHVNSTNRDGRTALMTASFRGAIAVVKVLLSHGAHIDAVDRFGATPLTEASMAGHRDVVTLLMSKRADKARKC
ncbi:MAG: ankyrin repeat domain-containing protein [Desulfomonilaceae bacterium]|nr:ankyrin repeat domain-containing protein [Desulfomonilaceae bacterium]